MKYLWITIGLIIGFSYTSTAQDRREMMREKIESQRVAFLTNKLELTTSEAQVFWPLYNEFKEKERAIKKDRDSPRVRVFEMNDDQAEEAIEVYFEMQQAQLELKKTYMEKFKSVLPASKVVRIIPAEDAFKRELLKRLKGRN